MTRTGHGRSLSIARGVTILMAATVLGLVAIAVAGCSQPSSAKAPTSSAPATQPNSKMMANSADTSPSVPSCYECSGNGKPPVVPGKATVAGGTQIVNVKIENGYYVPNKIMAKAGMPTKVIFTGKAKDCVGKPKFGSLGKQIDIRKTGTGTIDLGSLSAGTYAFTCGMGVNAGSITFK